MVVSAPQYNPIEGHFDEMLTPDGEVRPHWRPLADQILSLGRTELQRRAQESARLIRENGITYHVQREAQAGQSRPWPLDVVPCVLSAEDWGEIEAAVVQRARILNALLADIYGPQRTLREGLLPPAFVFSHPGYLRPCYGLYAQDGIWLNMLAIDFARAPDGRWRVIGKRTEAPIGAGYALENRLVTNETFGEAFDASGARRLASYFTAFKQSLAATANGRENPRVAILTPGPGAPTYFEHAFLARYLGYTLAEGSDLTVRERKVYLRTLGGLIPVDIIMRRQEAVECDPLELTSDSANGAAGLLQARRTGNVAVANALGSGFAESPALSAFLPRLAQALIGEDLLVDSAETWWCGDPNSLDHVLGNLENLVIKPSYATSKRSREFVARMGVRRREELADRLRANPEAYAGQELIPLSTTPVRSGTGLAPRPLVVRAFAVAYNGSYRVMPGGLARVSSSRRGPDVSVRSGGSCKDLWVVGAEPEPIVSLLQTTHRPIDVSRATIELPSRVGENLYWLGRYAERVEAGARLLRAASALLSLESGRRNTVAFESARALLTDLGYVSKESPPAGLQASIEAALFDAEDKGGFGWQIHQMRHVAWLLRDRLSEDAWRTISRLETDYVEARGKREDIDDLLGSVVLTLAAFSGAAMEAMTRGLGWRLLDIGRRLERALAVSALLQAGVAEPSGDERPRLELLLAAADSSITYRSRYLTSLQADLVIDLLLVDDANPRSIAFQLTRLKEHVAALPSSHSFSRRSPELRLVTDALFAVELAELDDLVAVEDGAREKLSALLTRIEDDLSGLSDTLTTDYLTHAKPFRHLAAQ
ncbi:MAG: circularly permuted type 2 ATP-grasp protein [Acidobacteria bacterium]|nr:circularly permuted type 2 ATP-grasp protein [Acidobacteriota bacterium]